MMFTIDSESFFLLIKNMWIEDSGLSCHITNNDTDLYDVSDANKLV